MRINHNIPALQAFMNLRRTERNLSSSIEKLSSSMRINSAKDDAAGLAIANKLDIQAKGLTRSSQNAMDGISLIQTAEGALNEVHNMLQRIRELAVQCSNDTMGDDDRQKSQLEIDSLYDEIESTSKKTEFNKIKILKGELSETRYTNTSGESFDIGSLTLQVGPNYNGAIKLPIPRLDVGTLFPDNPTPLNPATNLYPNGFDKPNCETRLAAQDTLLMADNAIAQISDVRATLGAYQNRLEMTIKNLEITAQNTEAARSRIQDTDMAKETTLFTQRSVMEQAGIAVLAQANQRPQELLALLR